MIKILDRKYKNQIIEYLNLEKEINTFSLQEIKNYGFNNVFYKIYADLDEKGEIHGIVLKCFDYLTFYSYSEFDIKSFCKLISEMNFKQLSGKTKCVKTLAEELNLSKCESANLCKIEYIEDNGEVLEENLKLKKINILNMKNIVKLYEEINEFQNTTIDNVRANLKSGRGFCIVDNKKVVSMAKSTAENKNNAMIVGVGTHPDYRNKGLASKCVIKLCQELLKENITPCLFYHSKEAENLYKKLGFVNIDNWSIYYNE